MPSRDRPRPSIALPVSLGLAILSALLPLVQVVRGGAWTACVVAAVVLLLTTAWAGRRAGLRAPIVSLVTAAVGAAMLMLLFATDTALLWLIPTPETFRAIIPAIERAVNEIVVGAAPLDAGPDLTFVIVGAAVLLTIALDHVVVTTRMPLLAAVALIAVYLIPSLAIRSNTVRVVEFVLFSASLLLLIALDTRERERARAVPADRPAPRAARPAGVATAAAIGVVAVVSALVVSPALPVPERQIAALGSGSAIDASLALGENLRMPEPIEVLRVQTTGISPPYLRAVTLSSFDGEVWEPDRGQGEPLDASSFDDLRIDPDVRVLETTTTVEVVDYVSPWLPIPFPATGVEGLDGPWVVLDENRTVLTREGSAQGQTYTVDTIVPRPTLEQARAALADPEIGTDRRDTLSLDGDPDVIAAIAAVAADVTAEAPTDYDKLAALQTWFRTQFTYSLDAPVEEGFDGSGIDAIASFLDLRSGYCVHFASAFAVMARTLDMPSRIVVGYLPGTGSGETRDEAPVYSVSSAQLHAWPEVYFQGMGWIPFEPTASLGTATRFWPATSGLVDDGGNSVEPSTAPTPSTAPSTDPLDDTGSTDASGSTGSAGAGALPALTVTALILALLAVPATARALRRTRRLAAASRDPRAAWDEVIDTAIDLGIPLPAGESPRALGARLVRECGVPPDAMRAIVLAIEHRSYARDPDGGDARLAEATRTVRGALREDATGAARTRATIAPRSLVIRAGSGMAAGAVAR